MDKLIQSMLLAFANNFTLYLKSHNFHWTVMGENFPQYHEFLQGIYEDAQGSIDDYAEQLRRLGAFPKGNYNAIVKETELADPSDEVVDPEIMFETLLGDLDLMVTRLQDTFDLATGQREYGLQNFLADRIDQHRKQQWMLNSILVEVPETDQTNQIIEPTQIENPSTGDQGYVIDSQSLSQAQAQGYKVK